MGASAYKSGGMFVSMTCGCLSVCCADVNLVMCANSAGFFYCDHLFYRDVVCSTFALEFNSDSANGLTVEDIIYVLQRGGCILAVARGEERRGELL